MTPKRKDIAEYGRARARGHVRVFKDVAHGNTVVRVQWREPGRKVATYEDTRQGIAEAKAFARGTHDRLLTPAQPAAPTLEVLTVRDLFNRYFAAHEVDWRDKTKTNKRARWKKWEAFIVHDTLAHKVPREKMDEFKKVLLGRKHSANQVRAHLELVASVFRWAVETAGILEPTRIATYKIKFSRDAKRQVVEMGEYTRAEREQIIAALDPRNAKEWRAWALNTLFAYCAPRQNAARHLEWDDIALEQDAGRIHWRADLDKMGTDRWQPMPSQVVAAFWVAYGWRNYDEYPGRYVFYGVQRRTRGFNLRRKPRRSRKEESIAGRDVREAPYTYSALNRALRKAETRAGILHRDYRATHGHRRGVAGDIHEITGSEKKAAAYIGDKSIEVVRDHYLLEREQDLKRSGALISGEQVQRTATETDSDDRGES